MKSKSSLLSHPQTFLKTVSKLPGVYQMRNAAQQIIYIGKARNLQQRLKSYFQKNRLNAKVAALMEQVTDIQCIITANETEALLLEANLIKEHRPRYNILLRDDKSYPYLYLTTQHDYPRLNIYRGARKEAGEFFGPYPSSTIVRDTLNLLQRLFKIRQCTDIDFSHRSRPCLQYQIQRCTAPCVDYVSKENYQQQVQQVQLFLQGRSSEIIREFTEEMQKASDALEFEKASALRDRISQLRQIQSMQFVANTSEEDLDVIEILRNAEVMIGVLSVRNGQVLNQQIIFLKDSLQHTDEECVAEFLSQYYLSMATYIPARILVPQKLADQKILESALTQSAKKPVNLYFGHREAWQAWRNMLQFNLKQTQLQQAQRAADSSEKLDLLQKFLKLKKPIERIECFDISHTQGDATMASCVVYGGSGLDKKSYRRFYIRDVEPGDDYAAIAQAVRRRYSRLLQENKKFPDIILIDGGRGQLQKAKEELEKLQILDQVTLLGIAKGEGRKPELDKIFMRDTDSPQEGWCVIPAKAGIQSEKILHLLQQIRDEAHRFALASHRKKRGRNFLRSPLENIPGIGAARRKALLEYFGGRQNLLQASIEEIARVPKMSLEIAKKVYTFLHLN